MQNILITTEGIQKNLKNIKPLDALCEYIWNGFDASASLIKVEVGNKLNSNGYIEEELDSHRAYGEKHLVHCDRTNNHKIYVMTWSDIFDEFSKRHDYLMSKLKLEEEIWMKKHETAD